MYRTENNIGETNNRSVKVHAPPGGKSNFSLSWDDDAPKQQRSSNVNQMQNEQFSIQKEQYKPQLQNNYYNEPDTFKEKTGYSRNEYNLGEGNSTSVKVHHPPGGKSNFTLG